MKRWVFGVVLGMGVMVAGCKSSSPPAPADSAELPSQQLQDFEMQDIQNGMKSMTLHAKEGKFYEDQHRADLETPVMTFYKEGKISSVLRAPTGQIDTLTHDVQASGGVTVTSADSTTMTTEHLQYKAETRRIHSSDPVHMVKPDSVSDGVGLDADPELNDVRIGHQTVHFHKESSS